MPVHQRVYLLRYRIVRKVVPSKCLSVVPVLRLYVATEAILLQDRQHRALVGLALLQERAVGRGRQRLEDIPGELDLL